MLRPLLSVFGILLAAPAFAQHAPGGTSDPNLAYSSVLSITPGTPFKAGRALYANCSGSGTTTVTLKDGTTLPWSLIAGFQQQPFSAIGVTAASGCTFGSLN